MRISSALTISTLLAKLAIIQPFFPNGPINAEFLNSPSGVNHRVSD